MSTYWFKELKNYKDLKEYDVLLGCLNLLGWIDLKSDEKINDDLNKHLAKKCDIGKSDIGKGW